MGTRLLTAAIAAFAAVAVTPARAHDPWEDRDDTAGTTNILRHGELQHGHDVDAVPPAFDVDWMTFVAKARHSYEARVTGRHWFPSCYILPCSPFFERVNAAGTVLTPGDASSEDMGGTLGSHGRTVRWIADTGGQEYVRVLANPDSVSLTAPYDVVMYDTTLFLPRWNNSATQTTILVLQNTTNASVTGFVYFYDGGGALLATSAVSVAEHGVQIIPTASIPALAGQSGSAAIAQLGGYAALAGKAVALEAATGFTFDTVIAPIPH